MNNDIIPPTKPEEPKVYMAVEMLSEAMSDWFINLDVIERETIIFEAYKNSVLSKRVM